MGSQSDLMNELLSEIDCKYSEVTSMVSGISTELKLKNEVTPDFKKNVAAGADRCFVPFFVKLDKDTSIAGGLVVFSVGVSRIVAGYTTYKEVSAMFNQGCLQKFDISSIPIISADSKGDIAILAYDMYCSRCYVIYDKSMEEYVDATLRELREQKSVQTIFKSSQVQILDLNNIGELSTIEEVFGVKAEILQYKDPAYTKGFTNKLNMDPLVSDFCFITEYYPGVLAGSRIIGTVRGSDKVDSVYLLGTDKDNHQSAVFKVSSEECNKLIARGLVLPPKYNDGENIPYCERDTVCEGYTKNNKNVALCSLQGDRVDVLLLAFGIYDIEEFRFSLQSVEKAYGTQNSAVVNGQAAFIKGIKADKFPSFLADMEITDTSVVYGVK